MYWNKQLQKLSCLDFLHIKYISSIYSLTQRNRFWSMSCYTSCSVRTHKEKGSTQSLGPIEYIHCRKAWLISVRGCWKACFGTWRKKKQNQYLLTTQFHALLFSILAQNMIVVKETNTSHNVLIYKESLRYDKLQSIYSYMYAKYTWMQCWMLSFTGQTVMTKNIIAVLFNTQTHIAYMH